MAGKGMKMGRDARMRESLRDHVLEEFPAGDRIRAFYLKKPGGGRMMSTLILFTPEGIVICGDLNPHPTGRGSASCFGYGLPWFASELDGGYLCSKFLDKEWQNELAVEWCMNTARDVLKGVHDADTKEMREASEERHARIEDLLMLRRGGPEPDPELKRWTREDYRRLTALLKGMRRDLADRYEKLARDAEEWDYGWESFSEKLRELDPRSCDDGVPGYGYPVASAGWLCAIQRRFAELYDAVGTPA